MVHCILILLHFLCNVPVVWALDWDTQNSASLSYIAPLGSVRTHSYGCCSGGQTQALRVKSLDAGPVGLRACRASCIGVHKPQVTRFLYKYPLWSFLHLALPVAVRDRTLGKKILSLIWASWIPLIWVPEHTTEFAAEHSLNRPYLAPNSSWASVGSSNSGWLLRLISLERKQEAVTMLTDFNASVWVLVMLGGELSPSPCLGYGKRIKGEVISNN